MGDGLFDVDNDVPESTLENLTQLCKEYNELEDDIAKLELKIKNRKDELEQISRVKIPSIFNTLGLTEIKLGSGQTVKVEDKLKASIADKNTQLAFRSMVNAEGGNEDAEEKVSALFKSRIIIEDDNEDILGVLLENDIPYEMKREIHYQTLAKYCRERLDHGEAIPEGISVFQYQETKIK